MDFTPIFYTFLKHHFYILGCKSLNFGLFEVWKKTVASIFIEDQNGGLDFLKKNIFDSLNCKINRGCWNFVKKRVINVWLIRGPLEDLGRTLKGPK